MISISELNDLIERQDLDYNRMKVAECLLQAIIDWPTELKTLEEFYIKIKILIGNNSIKKNDLEFLIQNLKPEHDAWHMESLSSLLNIYQYTSEEDLENILKSLG